MNADGESYKFLEEKHSGEIKSKCESLETERALMVYPCKYQRVVVDSCEVGV